MSPLNFKSRKSGFNPFRIEFSEVERKADDEFSSFIQGLVDKYGKVDLYRAIAAESFQKPIEEVDDLERQAAKYASFQALYGTRWVNSRGIQASVRFVYECFKLQRNLDGKDE